MYAYLLYNSLCSSNETVVALNLYYNETFSSLWKTDCRGSTVEAVLTKEFARYVEEVERVVACLGRVVDSNEEQTVLSLEEADALVC